MKWYDGHEYYISMSQTILLTGGAGYIGSACAQALLAQGHTVTVFDNLSTGQREQVPAGATFIEGDLTDQAAVRAAVGSAPFTTVIHLAAKKAVGESEAKPALYFANNVVGSSYLLSAMLESGIKRVVFSSTAVVYAPPTSDAPLTEDALCAPVSVYGASKYLVEQMLAQYVRTGHLTHAVSLRYFNVAGDVGCHFREHDPQNVFPLLAHAVQTGKPFSIFGTDYDTRDGTCIRDYIHLADLVDAHLGALNAPAGTYNLGTGTGYTVRELIAAFETVSGRSLNVIDAPRRPGDPAIIVASAGLAAREFNWQPKHTLQEMVTSTLAAYQQTTV